MTPKEWFNKKFKLNNSMSKRKGLEFLWDLKDPSLIYCNDCENDGRENFWKSKNNTVLICENCDYQLSPTKNSMLDSVKHIDRWIKAFWIMTGVDSPTISELKEKTNIESHSTAKKVRRLIRECMALDKLAPLTGNIKLIQEDLHIKGDSEKIYVITNDENTRLGIKKSFSSLSQFLNKYIDEQSKIIINKKVTLNNKYCIENGNTDNSVQKKQDFIKWYKSLHGFYNFPANLESYINEYNWRDDKIKICINKQNFKTAWQQRDLFIDLLKIAINNPKL